MRYDVLALGLLFVAILIGMYRWQVRRDRQRRASLFAGVLDLFETYRVTQTGTDYPRLEGRYRGHKFRLEAVPDILGLRKLPSLWLLATLESPLPWRGSLDLLMRPQNSEVWSPSSRFGHEFRPPESWPQHIAIRTNRPEDVPTLDMVGRHVGWFADPRAKEMLIAPGGVRLTYQADQGRSTHYMVLRQAEFERTALDRTMLRDLLEMAIAIHRDLAAQARTQAGRETIEQNGAIDAARA